MPEYTFSLLFWIAPIIALEIFFVYKKLLTPQKRKALSITVLILAAVGIFLDLFFAGLFFTFPNPATVIGIEINHIPIEEFIFYITGFWFIIYLYVFCDEYFLLKYNPSDEKYARLGRRVQKNSFYLHWGSLYLAIGSIILGIILKQVINPEGSFIPGYFIFLTLVAYTPMFLFFRLTRKYVNWRALTLTLVSTVGISIIWEVTLAIPRGYWGYQSGEMLGIFLPAWSSPLSQFPIEAVTVWIFCTLVILVYEYLKINFFTTPSS